MHFFRRPLKPWEGRRHLSRRFSGAPYFCQVQCQVLRLCAFVGQDLNHPSERETVWLCFLSWWLQNCGTKRSLGSQISVWGRAQKPRETRWLPLLSQLWPWPSSPGCWLTVAPFPLSMLSAGVSWGGRAAPSRSLGLESPLVIFWMGLLFDYPIMMMVHCPFGSSIYSIVVILNSRFWVCFHFYSCNSWLGPPFVCVCVVCLTWLVRESGKSVLSAEPLPSLCINLTQVLCRPPLS